MTEKYCSRSFIIAAISPQAYFGIVLLMAIQSACIPLPSEMIMPFAGYLVHTAASTCHSGDGGVLWVAISAPCRLLGGRATADGPWSSGLGSFVLLSRHDLDRVDHFFDKFGSITCFFGRMLPMVRTFIAFPAGIARMNQIASTSIPFSVRGPGAMCWRMWA